MKPSPAFLLAAILLAPAASASAQPAPTVLRLTLKNHRFSPEELTVPAHRRVRVELVNEDAASEEFDSEDLHVEQDVTPHGRTHFDVAPLKPGRYSFMGELHADTASGTITAVEQP